MPMMGDKIWKEQVLAFVAAWVAEADPETSFNAQS
jgi:hypothetical protein